MPSTTLQLYEEITCLETTAELQEQIGRLKSWAVSATHGATVSSLESKLGNSTRILGHVQALLKCIRDSILEVQHLTRPSSLSADSKAKLLEAEENVKESIEDLNGLIPHIKDPSEHCRYEDEAWAEQAEKYQQPIDTRHLRDKFPDAPRYLTKQLGEANARRRAKLAYAKTRATCDDDLVHGQKKKTTTSHRTESAFSVFRDSALGTSLPGSELHAPSFIDRRNNCTTSPILTSSEDDDDSESADSDPGSSVHGNDVIESRRVPSPPREFYDGKRFNCPVCMREVGTFHGHRAWKRHVLHDLEPYMCMVEGCPRSGYTYKSRRDWIAHQETHLVEWSCPVTDDGTFSSRADLETHLLECHWAIISTKQARALASTGARSSEANSTLHRCLLCRKAFSGQKAFLDHLATELEDIALFALPISAGFDIKDPSDSDVTGSPSPLAGLHRDVSPEDNPSSDVWTSLYPGFRSSGIGDPPYEANCSQSTYPFLANDIQGLVPLPGFSPPPDIFTPSLEPDQDRNEQGTAILQKNQGSSIPLEANHDDTIDPRSLLQREEIPNFPEMDFESQLERFLTPSTHQFGTVARNETAESTTIDDSQTMVDDFTRIHAQYDQFQDSSYHYQDKPSDTQWQGTVPAQNQEPRPIFHGLNAAGFAVGSPGPQSQFAGSWITQNGPDFAPGQLEQEDKRLNPAAWPASYSLSKLEENEQSSDFARHSSPEQCRSSALTQQYMVATHGIQPNDFERGTNLGFHEGMEQENKRREIEHTSERASTTELAESPSRARRLYKCTFPGCNATPFESSWLLTSHTQTHSSDRPYFCAKGCGKSFKRKCDAAKHEKYVSHEDSGSGVSRYCCPFCTSRAGKEHRYGRPDNLQRHVRTRHEDIDLEDARLKEALEENTV